jgi:hypothetical protein
LWEVRMNELLTLNIFAQSAPLAIFGVTLCSALIALPWWLRTEPDAGSGTHEAQLACD